MAWFLKTNYKKGQIHGLIRNFALEVDNPLDPPLRLYTSNEHFCNCYVYRKLMLIRFNKKVGEWKCRWQMTIKELQNLPRHSNNQLIVASKVRPVHLHVLYFPDFASSD